jgi:hypothetical protein
VADRSSCMTAAEYAAWESTQDPADINQQMPVELRKLIFELFNRAFKVVCR